jgi:type II secretory ATPase GspE/PulE/Tfp pilus assembly ATPase PilB-like protein
VVTSAVTGVFAMRLVRRLCGECREKGARRTMRAGRKRTVNGWEPAGCERCGMTGYSGRLPVVEYARITSGLRKVILGQPDVEALRGQLEAEQMITLWERALELVETGVTSPAEVERVLGRISEEPTERNEDTR